MKLENQRLFLRKQGFTTFKSDTYLTNIEEFTSKLTVKKYISITINQF
jgi:hypothetical protein